MISPSFCQCQPNGKGVVELPILNSSPLPVTDHVVPVGLRLAAPTRPSRLTGSPSKWHRDIVFNGLKIPMVGIPEHEAIPFTNDASSKHPGNDSSQPVQQRDICGVGLVLSNDRSSGMVAVGAICPGSPAACSGMIAIGDAVVGVDGCSVSGLEAFEVAELLKGNFQSLLRISLQKTSPWNTQYQVWLIRDRIPERDLVLMSQSDLVGHIGIQIVSQEGCGISKGVKPHSPSWEVAEIELGGSVWLTQACIKAGTSFRSTLMTGDRIEAVDSIPIKKFSDSSSALQGQPFSRIMLDVDRNGRKLLLDIVRTPALSGESLQHSIHRMDLIFSSVSTLEQALSQEGLHCSAWGAVCLNNSLTPEAPINHSAQNQSSGAFPKSKVQQNIEEQTGQVPVSPSGRNALNNDDEVIDSPRSTLSTDSLDDIVLTLSHSVASRHSPPMLDFEQGT